MTKAKTESTVTLRPNDLVLLHPNSMGFPPLARLVKVEFDEDGEPSAYFVRDVNASPQSDPIALRPNQVIQIFSGVL